MTNGESRNEAKSSNLINRLLSFLISWDTRINSGKELWLDVLWLKFVWCKKADNLIAGVQHGCLL